jgi:hypothetical protein
MMEAPETKTVLGLDLGQAADYTALAAIEQVPVGGGRPELHVRHLQRFRLGTSYPSIVEQVALLMATPQLAGASLLVDGTGVGVAVVDLLRHAKLRLTSVTVTGGDQVTRDDRGGIRVPKRDLVAAAQVALQSGCLKIAAALPDAQTLVRELLAYRVTISATGHDSYAAWREQDHDDLVFAVALACWQHAQGSVGIWFIDVPQGYERVLS